MAAAKKGKKSSKPKSGSKKKKKNNNTSFFSKFMLILLLCAVLVVTVFYILKNFDKSNNGNNIEQEVSSETNIAKEKEDIVVENKVETKTNAKASNKSNTTKTTGTKNTVTTITTPTNTEEKTAELKQEFKELKYMKGCWHSSKQGVYLTLDEYGTFRIDFMGVDASKPITGGYRIENNLIVFSNDGSECGNEDGYYRVNFYKENISLTCKDDNCLNRKNLLEADWNWTPGVN